MAEEATGCQHDYRRGMTIGRELLPAEWKVRVKGGRWVDSYCCSKCGQSAFPDEARCASGCLFGEPYPAAVIVGSDIAHGMEKTCGECLFSEFIEAQP